VNSRAYLVESEPAFRAHIRLAFDPGSRTVVGPAPFLYRAGALDRKSLIARGKAWHRSAGAPRNGHVAEWLRNGLQNRVPRFNSGRGLHFIFDSTILESPDVAPHGIGGKAENGCTEALSLAPGLCYRHPALRAFTLPVFPGSSAVEQPAVNRLVAGSNPARGATQNSLTRAPSH
jgi:hypothetical protein